MLNDKKLQEELLAMFSLGLVIGFLIAAVVMGSVKIENDKLKTQNAKLERQLLELYTEQAEQTKRTAERNGVGG
jgi:uncharacterized membrane protein YciS (DUF1049 family)